MTFRFACIGALCASLVWVGGNVVVAGPLIPTGPRRLLDTRDGTPLGAGGTAHVQMVDTVGLPATSTGVIATVTAVAPRAAGFLTVHGCGEVPHTSNLNYAAGETVAVTAVAALSADGEVCVTSSAATDVLVDLTGHLEAGSDLVPRRPARVADTRLGEFGAVGVKPAAGETVEVAVPAAIGAAAVLTVTVTRAESAGYLSVYPCGRPHPLVSQVTFAAGQTVANTVFVGLDEHRRACVFTSAAAHVVVDHQADVLTGRAWQLVPPARLADTRTGELTVDGAQHGAGPTAPAGTFVVDVAGRAGVPADAVAAVLSVTVTEPDGPGHVTAFTCGQAAPTASVLNHADAATVTATVISALDAEGSVCLVTRASTHVVVDVAGYVLAERPLLAAGGNHTCAVAGDGRVGCWGANQVGQLGNATFDGTDDPQAVVSVTGARSVAAGGAHSCITRIGGAVWCWGANSHGQVGAATTGPSATPLRVPLGEPATLVAAGDHHSCAATDAGRVWCWGNGDPVPARVDGVVDTVGLAAGGDTTCVLSRVGAVTCWGGWAIGEPPVAGASAITVGYHHACALVAAGVTCWGDDEFGQLDVPEMGGVARVATGSGHHTCAIDTDGRVSCWGANDSGQVNVPSDLPRMVDVTVGDRHTCARSVTGALSCWGDDTFGQLGGGSR